MDEKTVVFPYIKISQRGSYGTGAPWNVTVTQKSFCGQINLENTTLTEMTSVVCFFPSAGHLI